MTNIQSLKQYSADIKNGINSVEAWAKHQARLGNKNWREKANTNFLTARINRSQLRVEQGCAR